MSSAGIAYKPVGKQWIVYIVLFIFFFNSFLLPAGLTFVYLLTPVWIYFLYLHGQLKKTGLIIAPLVVFAFIHFAQGVDAGYYILSFTIIASLVTFLALFSLYLNKPDIDWDSIYRYIAISNFIFTILSVGLLFIPFLKPVVWYLVPISPNIKHIIPRLKLFTLEASHYSFCLAPVVIYFWCRVLFFKTNNPFLTLFIVTVPLLLSFSFGALAALLISFFIVIICYFKQIFSSRNKRLLIYLTIGLLIVVTIIAYYLYPDNVVFARIRYVFTGDDTSARGRTYEAFIIANKIVGGKFFWFGIGPGQLKLVGRSIILNYYTYSRIPDVIRVPNASAETIICYGYLGFIIRLLIVCFLFFKTRVYANPYRLCVFLVVFIYHFTGSYITNVIEYIMWIIAFSPVFPEFNRKHMDNNYKHR